jgi:hypothetical protein
MRSAHALAEKNATVDSIDKRNEAWLHLMLSSLTGNDSGQDASYRANDRNGDLGIQLIQFHARTPTIHRSVVVDDT